LAPIAGPDDSIDRLFAVAAGHADLTNDTVMLVDMTELRAVPFAAWRPAVSSNQGRDAHTDRRPSPLRVMGPLQGRALLSDGPPSVHSSSPSPGPIRVTRSRSASG
jgi:hypothetical protein